MNEITAHIDKTFRRGDSQRIFEIGIGQIQVIAIEVRRDVVGKGLIPLLEDRIERLSMTLRRRMVIGVIRVVRFIQRSVRSGNTLSIAMIDDISVGETRAQQCFAILFHGENAVERTVTALTIEIRSEKITVRRVQSTAVVLARCTHAAVWIVLLDERQDDREPFHIATSNRFARRRGNRIGIGLLVDRRRGSR